MNVETSLDKKRKLAAVVGAIAATVGTITTIIVGASSIPRESYLNHDVERKKYVDDIINGPGCKKLLRLNKTSFCKLVSLCKEKGLLRDTRNCKVEEQMAEFLHTIGHNEKNRVIHHNFRRSGETISRNFHTVLNAILHLRKDFIKQPTQESETPPTIRYDERFWPWFKDCIGAIDGTHIRASVRGDIRSRFRGRKVHPTQNVLAAVTFDLRFTFVLAGWEGSTHHSRILDNALTRPNGLQVPEGKYYLVDVGYPNKKGFLAPFRGVKYHLEEWEDHEASNSKEVFNHHHCSLRNSVERAFGVIKKRWKILDDSEPFFGYDTQVDIVLACCIIHNCIMGVDPDDGFFAEVDAEHQLQALNDMQHPENPTQRRRVTRREQQEETREWTKFRLKLKDDIWNNSRDGY